VAVHDVNEHPSPLTDDSLRFQIAGAVLILEEDGVKGETEKSYHNFCVDTLLSIKRKNEVHSSVFDQTNRRIFFTPHLASARSAYLTQSSERHFGKSIADPSPTLNPQL
jgi:hypothetical protein